MQTATAGIAFVCNLAVEQRALITNVVTGGPADKAGLRAGDLMTAIDKRDITDSSGAAHAISTSAIGQKVEVTYWTGTSKNTAEVTPIESPQP